MQTLLLKQALIGTDKTIADNLSDPFEGRIDSVESIYADLKTDSTEWKLLLRAGSYWVAERAGLTPQKVLTENKNNQKNNSASDSIIVTKIIKTSDSEETRAEISVNLSDCLERFMKQFLKSPQVIIHWLRRIAAAKLRLRTETLPDFLNAFSQRKLFKEDSREIIVTIIGKRGQWLAAQNDDWKWAADDDNLIDKKQKADLNSLEIIWNEGTFAERKSVLEIISQSDTAKAKKLLAETWKNEKSEYRAAFLETLSNCFDNSDEIFLDNVLRDRSTQIRQTAAIYLSQLPDSAFAKRINKLADQIIVTKNQAEKEIIQIEPPAEVTDQMKADGVEEKPPIGIGVKSWLVGEILKFVPLNYWDNRFKKTPKILIEAISKDDYFQSALYAWTIAIQYSPDNDQWLEAIWDAIINLDQNSEFNRLNIKENFIKLAIKKSPIKFLDKIKRLQNVQLKTDCFYYISNIYSDLIANMSDEMEDYFVANICENNGQSTSEIYILTQLIPFVSSRNRPQIKNLIQRIKTHNATSRNITSECESILEQCEQFDRLIGE
ncbi:MAG: DUF5691 domain-containing protein [Planctomycetaceae bacterium]|jgi:hypothetical protein|nr:DUF5691 domain-containing protein [Planctomycetaceae bacterium]